jgi:hypothetical protein
MCHIITYICHIITCDIEAANLGEPAAAFHNSQARDVGPAPARGIIDRQQGPCQEAKAVREDRDVADSAGMDAI